MAEFWLKAVGDNAYVGKEEMRKVRETLLQRLKDSVKETLVKFAEAGSFSDKDVAFELCAVVEAMFLFGWRDYQSRDKSLSYWLFIREGLKSSSTDAVARDLVTQVESSKDVRTDLHRGRVFLVECLRLRCLAYCVHRLQDQQSLCGKYYLDHSIWTTEEGATAPAMLVSLNAMPLVATDVERSSLEERATWVNVLEEIEGGEREGKWGPFGFIRAKSKEVLQKGKKKKKKPKRAVVVVSPTPHGERETNADDKRGMEDEDDEGDMRKLEDIFGKSPRGVNGANVRESALEETLGMLAGWSIEPSAEAMTAEELNALVAEEPPTLTGDGTASPSPMEESDHLPDEKDSILSMSPARFPLTASFGGGVPVPASSSSAVPSAEESVLGSLFMPAPPLRDRAASKPVNRQLFADYKEKLDEQEQPEDKDEGVHVVAKLLDDKGKEEAIVADAPSSQKPRVEEAMSAFERELQELEQERVRLEQERAGMLLAAQATRSARKDKDLIVVNERPSDSPSKSSSSPATATSADLPVLTVAADSGDLFIRALEVRVGEDVSATRVLTTLPRGGGTEDCPPTQSVRARPVDLLLDPSSVSLRAQGRICADCLREIPRDSSAHFCNFFARWFCGNCHRDETSVLPSRVLRLWDFKAYKVCCYAREQIALSSRSVLYDVEQINPGLFRVSEAMAMCRMLRIQLKLLVKHVEKCSAAPLELLPDALKARGMSHLWKSATQFSMHDLRLCHGSRLHLVLYEAAAAYARHVSQCQNCSARRHPCVTCGKLVFEFDIKTVQRCHGQCKKLGHRECLKDGKCKACGLITPAKRSHVATGSWMAPLTK